MELLEERLRIVESSLREQQSEKVLEPECEATRSDEPRSGNVIQPNPQGECAYNIKRPVPFVLT